MNPYKIAIKPTNNAAIKKFEANRFLTQHESFEFSTPDEAANSPLGKKLLAFPFINKVFITQNFVAIEKQDMVDWEDVEMELSSLIELFLNEGGNIIEQKEETTPKKVPVSIYVESTPNPEVMKFVASMKLVVNTCEFKNILEAKHAPLPRTLLQFPFVKEVFLADNYISIKKSEKTEWEEITMELREFIRLYLIEDKEIVNEEYATSPANEYDSFHKVKEETKERAFVPPSSIKNLDETSQKIIDILNEYVKPAVVSDGGNILFQSYDANSKTLKVLLQGACSDCPSSQMTLKNGIENLLKELIPDKVESVEAING